MQVGTLVRWTGDYDEDHGCLGIVSKDTGERFWVTWSDGEVVDYIYNNSHSKRVEVVCK